MYNDVFVIDGRTYSANFDFWPAADFRQYYNKILVFPEIVKIVNGRDIVRERGMKKHYYVFDWIKPSKTGRGCMAKSRCFKTIKAAAAYIEKNDQINKEMRVF